MHIFVSYLIALNERRKTYLTISKCPAQMALCNAVMPSSFAALGFGTCFFSNNNEHSEWVGYIDKLPNRIAY